MQQREEIVWTYREQQMMQVIQDNITSHIKRLFSHFEQNALFQQKMLKEQQKEKLEEFCMQFEIQSEMINQTRQKILEVEDKSDQKNKSLEEKMKTEF